MVIGHHRRQLITEHLGRSQVNGIEAPQHARVDRRCCVEELVVDLDEIQPLQEPSGPGERRRPVTADGAKNLDPGEGTAWSSVIEAAGEIRDALLALGLKSFVKTSGGKGLHVVVPVEPRTSWAEAKSFTADVVTANLTAALVIKSAPVLLAAVRPGGILILSGIQSHEGAQVRQAFSGAEVCWERDEDGWVGLVVKKT